MTKLIINTQNKLSTHVLSNIWGNIAYLIAISRTTNNLQLNMYNFVVSTLQNSILSHSKSTFNIDKYRIGNAIEMSLERPKMHSMHIEDKRRPKRSILKILLIKLLIKLKLQ